MFDHIVILALVTLVAMSVHSAMGFGFAQFLAPVLLALRPAEETVTALLSLAILINALVAVDDRPAAAGPKVFAPLLGGAAVGVPLGVWLLASADKRTLQILSGGAILAAALLQATGGWRSRGQGRTARRVGPLGTVTAGLSSGVLTAATGIGAAPAILWLERGAPTKELMRWAISAYSLVLCVAGVVLLLIGSGGVALSGLALAAVLAPCAAVGHALGRRAFRRAGSEHYRTLALLLVTASGASSVVAGLLSA